MNQHTTSNETTERDWPEDFEHENGQYMNTCRVCEQTFIGYKRRSVCKVCDKAARASLPPPSAEPVPKHSAGLLGELLARIHRDGGQRQWDVGTEQAIKEADEIVAMLFAASPPIQVAPSEPVMGYVNLETLDFAVAFYQNKVPEGYLPIYLAPVPQVAPEQNFCARCGKRNIGVHTCTPPEAEVAPEQASLRKALERAAQECIAWGDELVIKWQNDDEMFTNAKARAWDGVQLAARIRALISKEAEPGVDARYNELIFAVGMKHPNETRHQTALRYIRQAEHSGNEKAMQPTTGKEPT